MEVSGEEGGGQEGGSAMNACVGCLAGSAACEGGQREWEHSCHAGCSPAKHKGRQRRRLLASAGCCCRRCCWCRCRGCRRPLGVRRCRCTAAVGGGLLLAAAAWLGLLTGAAAFGCKGDVSAGRQGAQGASRAKKSGAHLLPAGLAASSFFLSHGKPIAAKFALPTLGAARLGREDCLCAAGGRKRVQEAEQQTMIPGRRVRAAIGPMALILAPPTAPRTPAGWRSCISSGWRGSCQVPQINPRSTGQLCCRLSKELVTRPWAIQGFCSSCRPQEQVSAACYLLQAWAGAPATRVVWLGGQALRPRRRRADGPQPALPRLTHAVPRHAAVPTPSHRTSGPTPWPSKCRAARLRRPAALRGPSCASRAAQGPPPTARGWIPPGEAPCSA